MEKLNILWTTADKLTALNMIAMYATNSALRGWWNEIVVIIWGGSAGLVAKDDEVQMVISSMLEAGVKVKACKACSDKVNATEKLLELGVEVMYMGESLTQIIKNGEKLLTI